MAGWLGSPYERPSDIMLQVLEGKLHHDDAPESVRSMLTLQYHTAATEILGLPKESMKKALDRVPDTCKSEVRKQMLKLWRK